MREGRTLSIVVALTLVAGTLLLVPHGTAAAIGAGGQGRTEAQWQQEFERLRQADPSFRVQSATELRRMHEYHNDLANDGRAVRTFRLAAGELIRCVEIASQRAFLASAADATMPPLAPSTPPREIDKDSAAAPTNPATLGAMFGLDSSRDQDGNVRSCPALTFPQLVPPVENLYRFRRLEEMFQKYPDGHRGTPPIGGEVRRDSGKQPMLADTTHEYAHAYRTVDNTGSQADFNLWSPFVEFDSEFSLSQLWVTRGDFSDSSLQTIEVGWQVYKQLYSDTKAHLFIYFTTAAYASSSGCYNLSCTGFVQTDSTVVIAGTFTNYSTIDGQQYQATLSVYRDPSGAHNWWLRINGVWVGYYPNSLFNTRGLANVSSKIDFGGEILNDAKGGVHTRTHMGSGRFPVEGWQRAAFTKKIQYWDAAGSAFNATGLTRSATNASYYDLQLLSTTDANWLQYYYFGGPGRSTTPTCTYTLVPSSSNVPASASTGSVAVQTSDSSCAWIASSNAAWLRITSGASGTGNGQVFYAIDANTGAARTGRIAAQSQIFTVNQAGQTSACVAHRTLPDGYAPGQALAVSIATTPPTGSSNHALEDTPPSGWTISAIDNSGTWDAANRKIKWGPFFDTTARTVRYTATPPAGATGTATFQGVISIDGVPQAICGDSTVAPGAFHPADTNSNWLLEINEATAYGSAWKGSETWPRPPNPIPIDYVTNAGFLWKSGESYHHDGSKAPPWATGASPRSPVSAWRP
jgi:hypothetical protein